jgi:transposase
VGRPLTARLLADGEAVVDVPATLAARVRMLDTTGRRAMKGRASAAG